jgi:plastocyanin domain-containing protein
MERILVTAAGFVIIAGISWFFWGKKDEEAAPAQAYEIKVSGGYKPRVIKIRADKPVRLTFVRTDSNSCLEEVVFPDYKIKKFLPLNEPVEVVLPSPHPQNSGWHCSMNMYSGKIIAV